ncbi:MAG: orotidine-5'-phosphate decarboxylase [Polyangiaceae bacterium]|nr:orotidine-5'-phosphate decarboxylase [Polyangiaceae bacterium]
MGRDCIAVALDVSTLEEAKRLAGAVAPHVGVLKVGLELFVRYGTSAVEAIAPFGVPIFLDLKLHDIPETVGRSVASARDLGVRFLTIHASGGPAMLRAAANAAGDQLRLLGVTVLTSISPDDLRSIGVSAPVDEHARSLARACHDAGVTGLVTSALEAPVLRRELPSSFLVTPGIRPSGAARGDQSRVATPGDAVRAGADLLVVGRPIRDAADPAAAARAIADEVDAALAERA